MDIRQVIGILVILGAYGLTWLLLLRSLRIVKIIDREGLDHAGEIRARLKGKAPASSSPRPGETGPQGKSAAADEQNKSKEK
jgi:hypothetical protein